MKRYRRTVLVLALAAAVVAAGTTTALTQGTHTSCAASFHVLHDDRIGDLRLPEGAYQLRTDGVSCVRASHLFSEFLSDWNGVLPRPWRYTVNGVGDGTFSRPDNERSFQAVRTGAFVPGSPGHASDGGGSHGTLECPGAFEVEHNDRIGALRIPRGDYTITRLGARISCVRVAQLFARFLQHPDGRLRGGWVVLPLTGEFMRRSSHYGFRIQAAD